MTWVPGPTHASSTPGVGEEVTRTTMSAPSTASRGLDIARRVAGTWPAISPMNRSRLAARGLHTRTSRRGLTCVRASRWLRAWTPVPRIAMVTAPARAR